MLKEFTYMTEVGFHEIILVWMNRIKQLLVFEVKIFHASIMHE